jgi:hypothetical protein
MNAWPTALCLLALAAPPAGRSGPLFPVVTGGKWGYVDRDGRLVVSPRFDEASRFSEGLAPVRLGRQAGYADETGRMVLVPDLEPADGTLHRRFSGGRAAVRAGRRYGFIDATGRLAVPARWLSAEDFSEGRALVCDEEGCGFVDPDGRYLPVPAAMGGTPFRGGMASIALAMGMTHRRTAFVDAALDVLPGRYEGNGSYSEGLAPVRFRGTWGFVDVAGTPVILNRFQEAGDFSEGLAAVTLDTGRCGYVDRTGAITIPARFASCRPFSGGRALVDLSEEPSDGERPAFVDRDGAVAIRGDTSDPPFRAASDFTDGLAAVGDGPLDLAGEGQVRLGYVDATGRFVWPLQR